MTGGRVQGWRALIVEDDALVARAFKRCLQLGYDGVEVLVAADFRRALELLRARAPLDIAVVDVRVPGGPTAAGGLDVLDALPRNGQAPVRVVVSAVASAPEWARAGRAGVMEVLEMPASGDAVLQALARETARLLAEPLDPPADAGADECARHVRRLTVRDALNRAGSVCAAARSLGWSRQKTDYNLSALGLHELPRDRSGRRRWVLA